MAVPGRLLGAFALTLFAAGCGGAVRTAPPRRVDPAFVPAFERLKSAVVAHDDDVARRILAGILARDPVGDTRAQAEAFERVLDGREIAALLDVSLEAEPVEGGLEVALRVRSAAAVPVELEPGPGSFHELYVGVDPRGIEDRRARSTFFDGLRGHSVAPGGSIRVPVGVFEVPTGSTLAVRASFELHLAAGEAWVDGSPVPVRELPVSACERVVLAPWLPAGPVEPAELARYAALDEPSLPALLERTVRVPWERREEALELLSSVVGAKDSPGLVELVPTLRWLSGQRHFGREPEAWRRFMEGRARAGEAAERPRLDLPGRATEEDGR